MGSITCKKTTYMLIYNHEHVHVHVHMLRCKVNIACIHFVGSFCFKVMMNILFPTNCQYMDMGQRLLYVIFECGNLTGVWY